MPETICLTKYTLETDLLVGLFCFRSMCAAIHSIFKITNKSHKKKEETKKMSECKYVKYGCSYKETGCSDCIAKAAYNKAIEDFKMNSDQNPEDSNLEDTTKLEETGDYITTAYGSLYYLKCKKCGRDDIIDTNGYNFCPYCGRKITY